MAGEKKEKNIYNCQSSEKIQLIWSFSEIKTKMCYIVVTCRSLAWFLVTLVADLFILTGYFFFDNVEFLDELC